MRRLRKILSCFILLSFVFTTTSSQYLLSNAQAQDADPHGVCGKDMYVDYKACSKDCKTVCIYGDTKEGMNCFKCEQGGDDTCKDIGQLDFPHPWCQPGGVCYDSPDLVCTKPFAAVGPHRSKLTCTNCKKRPDLCWTKVKNGTKSYTNCRIGCLTGTCRYVGKYKEKEWDGKDEFLHCYECIRPPPPPHCEDLKWGYDWKNDCLNHCQDPGYCKEFHFEVGKKNPEACVQVDTSEKKGKKGENGNKGGTHTRGGKGGGGKKPAGPNEGINNPYKPFGPNETAESVRKKTPCEEVEEGLRHPDTNLDTPSPAELERRQKWMKRFQTAVEKLKKRAAEIDQHLSPQRAHIKQLESQLPQAKTDLQKAKAAARGAEHLGGYGQKKLKELKAAQDHFDNINSELRQSRRGLNRQVASFSKDIDALKADAQRALYQADPSAKLSEDLSRTDSYYEAWRDYEHNEQAHQVSEKVFNEKIVQMQKKVDHGGRNADKYQEQLDNLKRGKQEWDAVYQRRQRALGKDINRMQKENGEMGVGPYDRQTLLTHAGQAAAEINKQIGKLKELKRLMEKAAKNGCPPKGADKVAREIGKKLQDLGTMMRNLENRYQEIENGFQLPEEDKRSIAQSVANIAEGSKKMGPVRSRASFFFESLGEETLRTITDPKVAFKKAFWYTVGIVEGVGKAIKGVVDLGVGALDLTAETIEGYLHSGDETLFGRDASEALQKIFEAADGNINLDGLEKLGQSIQKQLLSYEKKLLGTDMDKTVSRIGGHVAGEIFVGNEVIAAGLGKVGTFVKGTEEASQLGRTGKTVAKGVEEGSQVGRGVEEGTEAGRLAGKTEELPQPKVETTPSKPRAPPVKAKDFKGTRLPDVAKATEHLSEETAASMEKVNGFRADHAEKMYEFAQEKGVYLVVRDGNPESIKFMDNPDMMPKPMSCKAKTAKVGPPSNKGLVVDPTHPVQAKYWDDAIREAELAGDKNKLDWLKANRVKAEETWAKYSKDMEAHGYSVNAKTGVIEYTDPVTGKHFTGVHGDYDIHGVFKPAQGGAAPKKVSFGSGQKFDEHGVDVESQALRQQLNEAIDAGKQYIQHGGQDDWVPDPHKVPIKASDPPVTVFYPDGRTPVRLKTADEMKQFYTKVIGIKWEYK